MSAKAQALASGDRQIGGNAVSGIGEQSTTIESRLERLTSRINQHQNEQKGLLKQVALLILLDSK